MDFFTFLVGIIAKAGAEYRNNNCGRTYSGHTEMVESAWDYYMTGRTPRSLYVPIDAPVTDEFLCQNVGRLHFI